MAELHNVAGEGMESVRRHVRAMDDGALMGQELSQQGAINAVAFLLRNGAGGELAATMLANLREVAAMVREETKRRGRTPLFPVDQTGFT